MRALGLALLLAIVPQAVAAAETIQEVLLRAKPAVALVLAEVSATVTLGCPGGDETAVSPAFRETGTGWFVHPAGWLVTNGHVVSPAHRPPAWLGEQLASAAERPGCRASRVVLDPSISVVLANGQRFAATVTKYGPRPANEAMSGRDLALLRLETADLPTLPLGDSSGARIGDRIHILGFPGVVLTHELLKASTKVEASITNGTISGLRRDRAGQAIIQTDAPAAWGNSGGPAIDDRGRVVGVLTFVPHAAGNQDGIVQGFNFVIPAEAVRQFLHGTEVAPGERSRFDEAWGAGLRRFFDGDHGGASPLLAEANRLMPELPDVMRISLENTERTRNSPPRSLPWTAVAVGLMATGVAAYGLLLGVRWRRNRFRIPPSEVVRLIETGEPPVILDVREMSTYEQSPVRIANARHVPPPMLEAGTVALDIDAGRTVVAYCT